LSWEDHGSHLRLWDSQGKLLHTLDGGSGVNGALELSDGRLLSWAANGRLLLSDGQGDSWQTFEGHTASVYGALELCDGRLLSWAADHTLRLWDTNAHQLATFYSDTQLRCCLVLSDQQTIVAGVDEGYIMFLRLVA
jgi:WD40 repeat protein